MLDPFAPDPDALTDRELEAARWHPERETLALAATGAAVVLGALKTKCTSCDDRHIGARKDALYLDQENWETPPQPTGDGTMSWRKSAIFAVDCAAVLAAVLIAAPFVLILTSPFLVSY